MSLGTVRPSLRGASCCDGRVARLAPTNLCAACTAGKSPALARRGGHSASPRGVSATSRRAVPLALTAAAAGVGVIAYWTYALISALAKSS